MIEQNDYLLEKLGMNHNDKNDLTSTVLTILYKEETTLFYLYDACILNNTNLRM